MRKYGEIARLSASTYVLDCGKPIKEYLRKIGHKSANIGSAEVWVRYGPSPPSKVRKKPYPVAVGGSRKEVEMEGR